MSKRKQIVEMNLLDGQTEEISVMQLRQDAGDILMQVRMGKTFTITKSGKAVAVLSKLEPTAAELGGEIRQLGMVGKNEP